MGNIIFDALTLKKSLLDSRKRLKLQKHIFVDVINDLDYDMNIDSYLDYLIYLINNNYYEPSKPIFMTSPKSKGLQRVLSLIYIEDAILLDALVLNLSKELEPLLLDGVRDHRLGSSSLKYLNFRSWYYLWNDFQKDLMSNIDRSKYDIIMTDITSFFDSIDITGLKAMLLEHCPSNLRNFIELIMLLLTRYIYHTDVTTNSSLSLPQIDLDSIRFLATFYLHEHDEKLQKLGLVWFRWLDDMYILSNESNKPMDIVNFVNHSLRGLGLSINSEKTKVIDHNSAAFQLSSNLAEKIKYFETQELLTRSNMIKRECISEELTSCYEEFSTNNDVLNLSKVMKSFYVLFRKYNNKHLVKYLEGHLNTYVSLYDQIFSYLLHIKNGEDTVVTVLDLLLSTNNMMDENTIIVLNYLLNYRVTVQTEQIAQFALDAFCGLTKRKFSDISKCILSLLIAKYGKRSDMIEMIDYFNSTYCANYHLARHMLWSGTLVKDSHEYHRMQNTMESGGVIQISRMKRFIEKLENYEIDIPYIIVENIKNKKLYNPKISYLHISTYILIHILLKNEHNYTILRNQINNIIKENEDIIMAKKLHYLLSNIKYHDMLNVCTIK